MNAQFSLKVMAATIPAVTRRTPWINGPGGGWVFHFSDGMELIVATDIRVEQMVVAGPFAWPAGSRIGTDTVQRGARVEESPQLAVRSFIFRRRATIIAAITPPTLGGQKKMSIYLNGDSGYSLSDIRDRFHLAFHSMDGIQRVNIHIRTSARSPGLSEPEQQELEALNGIRMLLFLLHAALLDWTTEPEREYIPHIFSVVPEVPPIVADEFGQTAGAY